MCTHSLPYAESCIKLTDFQMTIQISKNGKYLDVPSHAQTPVYMEDI